jgi:LL-diaminopimelate aminotransferase
MVLINSRVLQMTYNDVQSEINKRIGAFKISHPQAAPIYLNSSDAILPLGASVTEAMRRSIEELDVNQIAPIKGYPFLIEAIVKNDFRRYKLPITADDIFVNAGVKQDIVGISDIFCKDIRIGQIAPVSQVYIKSNIIGYRAGTFEDDQWNNVFCLPIGKSNCYTPDIPDEQLDVVFLSYPSNPTGAVISRESLTEWVNFALENDMIILYDASYEAFIRNSDIPRSIYEIKNANKVAIEFHSFAKNAGFTGLHCGYTVIPQKIMGYSFSYDKQVSLNELWMQRQMAKNNAPSYILQRGAEALYTLKGKIETQANVDYYMKNAAALRQVLGTTKLTFHGGEHSPYIWVESPDGNSWSLFDTLLNKCNIVSVPGEQYGNNPDGCVRISSFARNKQVMEACINIKNVFA